MNVIKIIIYLKISKVVVQSFKLYSKILVKIKYKYQQIVLNGILKFFSVNYVIEKLVICTMENVFNMDTIQISQDSNNQQSNLNVFNQMIRIRNAYSVKKVFTQMININVNNYLIAVYNMIQMKRIVANVMKDFI